jgi:uncharacterized damage-inducible protein DinB
VAAGHLMYATVIAHDYWAIESYEESTGSWETALAYFNDTTEQALDSIRDLPNTVFKQKRRKPDGSKTSAWRFFMTMLEHEVSHRALLESYLMLLNVRQPRLDGVSIEAVRAVLYPE